MTYDVIITGGGIAGLTAAAYLSKAGYSVLLSEKEEKVGGLVSSFEYKGFTFDGGIRSIENSGIVMPMLNQLGIEVPFVKSVVSLGIDKDIIKVETKDSVDAYKELLKTHYPTQKEDIDRIIKDIKKIMKYMDILYGIDNPLFMDMLKDKKYLFKTILPWLFKFIFTVGKIKKLNEPVDRYLDKLTTNGSLNSIISQHFFKSTPTFFALSYFSLYLDYQYPLEGTGMLIDKLEAFIQSQGGTIQTSSEITSVNVDKHEIMDALGNTYQYSTLLWAADLNKLYQLVNQHPIKNLKIKEQVASYQEEISKLRGGDSIQTVYMTVNMDVSHFKNICTGHFFYTPVKEGLGEVERKLKSVIESKNKETIVQWLKNYFKYNTYEISIPALRNPKLAPKGKTGLIISVLMDYDLVKLVASMGWYDEYKKICEDLMIKALDQSIFNGIEANKMDVFSSTPLTIEKRTANKDGAITGWAFTNHKIPVVTSMTGVAKSVLTPMPDVYQAGQWSYSPSGLPISIMTAKLAVDRMNKTLKKKKKIQ